MAPIVLTGMAAVIFISFGAFAIVSRREGESRATIVAGLLAVGGAGVLLLLALLPVPVPGVGLGIVAGITILAVIFWFAPISNVVAPGGRPSRRVDERDVMFARGHLVPGSPQFKSYYEMRPENRAGDDRTRALPGLLSPNSEFAEEVAFAAAEASFDITEALGPEVDGDVAPDRVDFDPGVWVDRLKELARSNGAVDVGVARLEPYHIYSHIGRGAGPWGESITLDHSWAIAFTVEMDHTAVAHAPGAPAIVESARQYVESAKIAVQLAAVIRRCGWRARAHIDGNYRVIAPLVARDAGLGEIGRMGLLMTPGLGPRIRLGVVTTDVPLVADAPGDDPSVLDFCAICRKCAETCPVGAIPGGDRTPIDDGRRWAIDSDTCFRYWHAVGTDCGRCMSVCPYSHPDNAIHNVVRWAIAHSGGARRAMMWMDDLFYGRNPKPRGSLPGTSV
ncbi:MAG: 4Fe-4S dicluster domain-containing protein [Thermoanaerobaculales bacterium]|nr:4Fe-4S dicluster domain-containing protein [Thermoanaerobaculales bacterium]